MDIFSILRQMMAPSPPPSTAGDAQTRMQLNQPDLDPTDGHGNLLPGGTPMPGTPVVPAAPVAPSRPSLPTPVNITSESLRAVDRYGAVPVKPVTARPVGYGAAPRQTSFGDGTGSQ